MTLLLQHRSGRGPGQRPAATSILMRLGVLVGSAGLAAAAVPSWAQEPSPGSLTGQTLQRIEEIKNEAMGLQRAINLARGTAAQLNGGLSVYRPQVCMFQGISNNPCLIDRSAAGYTFRFLGGSPGWEQLQLPATVETELLISRDGRSVLQILYNGSPRPQAAPVPLDDTEAEAP